MPDFPTNKSVRKASSVEDAGNISPGFYNQLGEVALDIAHCMAPSSSPTLLHPTYNLKS